MERYWRSLPEDCVKIIYGFLGFPYPPKPRQCKHMYDRHCKYVCSCIDCCCERYTAAAFIFALCVGFIMGEALSRI